VDERGVQETLQLAYHYLGRRDRTVAEVRAHLGQAYIPVDLIDAAVAELIEQRYLDDERYARRFAEDRRNLDGWGAGRIRRRLLGLGVAREIAEDACQPADAEQEMQSALAQLRRRLRVAPQDPRGRRRAVEMLMRRGYGTELAYAAVKQLEREGP
jgi:regulatory protein